MQVGVDGASVRSEWRGPGFIYESETHEAGTATERCRTCPSWFLNLSVRGPSLDSDV